MEIGGFAVLRVWMKKKKGNKNKPPAFNLHVRWQEGGEEATTVVVGSLTDKNKADLAAVRALLEAAAKKENNKRQRQQQEGEKDDDDGPLIGDKEKESGRCVCLVLIVERGV